MSFWGDLTGKTASDAANAAAADTYAKQKAAGKDLTAYGDQYANQYAGLSQAYNPYTQAGQGSLTMLQNGLGLGGAGGQQAFTDAYHGLPGYQAGLDTGVRAIDSTANSNHMLQSGRTLKDLQRFGQNYEDQKSGDYLNRLAGLSQQGLGATQAQVNTQGQGLQGQLATRQSAYGGAMNAANTIGLGQVAGAQAQQAGASNLWGTGAYLGGQFLGGKGGQALGTKLFG